MTRTGRLVAVALALLSSVSGAEAQQSEVGPSGTATSTTATETGRQNEVHGEGHVTAHSGSVLNPYPPGYRPVISNQRRIAPSCATESSVSCIRGGEVVAGWSDQDKHRGGLDAR